MASDETLPYRVSPDEFLAQLAAEHAATQAATPTLDQPTAKTAAPELTRQPVPRDISELMELCQKHALAQPAYDYKQLGSTHASTFAARLSLTLPARLAPFAADAVNGGDDARVSLASQWQQGQPVTVAFDEAGFKSKKASKCAVSATGCAFLKGVLGAARNAGLGAAERGAAPAAGAAENHIGLLYGTHPPACCSLGVDARAKAALWACAQPAPQKLTGAQNRAKEFALATRNSPPQYTEHSLGRHFSCTVTLTLEVPASLQSTAGAANNNNNDPSTPAQTMTFGTPDRPYGSKKGARAAAAGEAVLWLRANGLLAAAGAAPPRRRTAMAGAASRLAGANDDDDGGEGGATSYAQRVVQLRKRLGLSNLEYRLEAAAPGSAYHSGVAYLRGEADPRLTGPLGVALNVHGRANAKEEIAKGVCGVLEELLQERMGDIIA